MDSSANLLKQVFAEQFPGSGSPVIYRAPGRVNLIGEHTDYNQGFVLPIAINLACYTAAAPSPDGVLRVYSRNFDERREWPVQHIANLQPADHWSDYFIGVAQQLIRAGYELQPLSVALYSTVPVGSGLSSSASIEVSSALALLDGRDIDKTELALLCQRAEREFVGVPCGIMDQYVSVFGEQNKAIQIDCRTITHQTADLPSDVAILVINSMVKHALGDSAYRTRVRECSEAVNTIRATHPDVASLRDVSSATLDTLRNELDPTVFRRAWHVTTENERVLEFSEAAARNDLPRMGRLFLASHRSLQRDYEVSCEELDFLVELVSAMSGVYGSRMTGGGFGGCTVNLVLPDQLDAVEHDAAVAYRKRFNLEPQFYRTVPAEGAGKIS